MLRQSRAPRGARGLKYKWLNGQYEPGIWSRSSRSAWIEICTFSMSIEEFIVALLAERVD